MGFTLRNMAHGKSSNKLARLGPAAPVVLLLSVWPLAAPVVASPAEGACQGTLYLTLDTGSMGPAEEIAKVLRDNKVQATFFLADEKTTRGDRSLDPSWAPFWKRLASEGHSFGSHTFRHWYFRGDLPGGRTRFVSKEGESETMDAAAVCQELQHVDRVFHRYTGQHLQPIWRAPGGRTTPNALRFAKACGYRHVGWAPAGFLGDELPSDRFPNAVLREKALAKVKDGDILMMHLGIWSRKQPFWVELDGLLKQWKARGFCFAPIRQ